MVHSLYYFRAKIWIKIRPANRILYFNKYSDLLIKKKKQNSTFTQIRIIEYYIKCRKASSSNTYKSLFHRTSNKNTNGNCLILREKRLKTNTTRVGRPLIFILFQLRYVQSNSVFEIIFYKHRRYNNVHESIFFLTKLICIPLCFKIVSTPTKLS